MNPDKCNLHLLPMNQICGADNCSIIMCEACFVLHQGQSKHSSPVVMSESTIAFFIEFNDYILKKLDEFIAAVKSSGINGIFKIIGGIPNYWDSKTIIGEIQKTADEVIIHYRNLMQNNRNYVAQNRCNYHGLLHPQFLKDIYTFIKQNWQKSSQKISEQLHQTLMVKFPTRYIYKRIKFQINAVILNEIQSQKWRILSQNPEKVNQMHRQPSKLSDLQISKVQSVIEKRGLFEQKKNPILSTSINSFYEILESSQVHIQQNEFQMAQVLRKVPAQQISPNFLSYEALEKQIEELLIENQKLRQANSQLTQENVNLKRENDELKANTQ